MRGNVKGLGLFQLSLAMVTHQLWGTCTHFKWSKPTCQTWSRLQLPTLCCCLNRKGVLIMDADKKGDCQIHCALNFVLSDLVSPVMYRYVIMQNIRETDGNNFYHKPTVVTGKPFTPPWYYPWHPHAIMVNSYGVTSLHNAAGESHLMFTGISPFFLVYYDSPSLNLVSGNILWFPCS